jgi:hypothetical protein
MTAKGEDGSKQVVANTNRDKIIMLEYNYNTTVSVSTNR